MQSAQIPQREKVWTIVGCPNRTIPIKFVRNGLKWVYSCEYINLSAPIRAQSVNSTSPKSLRSKWHRAVVTVLAASRRDANMTQEDLALRLGWHRTRIAKIESGERRIDVPEFINIANALNIAPETLLARVLRW